MAADNVPARVVPLLYLGTAHLALGLASFLVAWWPRSVAGFFYHSWMVAVVHLVTLGWITFSILGAIYIVGPVALRMPMPTRRSDGVAYVLALVGVVGMVAHFWIGEFGGMAWSAATAACGIGIVAIRIVRALPGAGMPGAVKLHLAFACLNIVIAATTGVLIGFDKVFHFLPGFVISNVFAHAHLAAIGWATMMLAGVGYRMLPMTLPSKQPAGRSMYASAFLLEAGVLGLFGSLLVQSRRADVFGVTIVAGLAVFAAHVIGMVRSPAPKPHGAPRIDFGVMHAAAAAIALAGAVVLGLTLLAVPASPRTLRLAAAYGVLGLVGFLAQMVISMEARLVPLVAWYWAYKGSGYRVQPPSPPALRDRMLQGVVFGGWTLAVPALAAGLLLESAPLVAVGGWSLLAAVAIGTLDNLCVLTHEWRRRRPDAETVYATAGAAHG
jgi:hypothetical protein